MKNNKKENIFNQHSALTTFKVKDGKYYKIGVEKSIFALLLKSQYELKEEFKKLFLTTLNQIGIAKENHENVLEIAFTNKKDFNISTEILNSESLKTVSKTIIDFKVDQLKKRTSDERIIKLKTADIKNLSLNNLDNDKINDIKLNQIILEIKDYCKDIAVKNQLDQKEIDFTILANSIGTNSTKLKKNIVQASKTVLQFNYINKKNIEIDIVTSLLASARFEIDKKKKTTWFTYQIPKEILELLLIPKVYVPLEGVVVNKLNGVYTLRMYSLLKDHLKRGTIELTKEEMFEFFALPKSYLNKTNLINKFLKPTLEEVEKVSGIATEYEFVPKNRYKKVVFKHKLERKVKTEAPTIVEKGEKIEKVKGNEKILKKIEKAKRNIYISKSWNKRTDNKIKRILKEDGEEYAIFILDALYSNLKKEIQTTLVQYINGIIKNNPKNEVVEEQTEVKSKKEEVRSENLKINKEQKSLFGDILDAEIVENSKEQVVSKKQGINSTDEVETEKELKEEEISEITKNFIWGMFEKIKKEEQERYKKAAVELFLEEVGKEKLDKLHTTIYKHAEREYIIKVMEKEMKG
ncbi:MAG: replication initiation protein [Psychrilyobacter sp.]|uniref:hypothetical protein n=1 Tax=Psychrilyobacter sp. TaxID=2586924 RepID=UPI003C788373